MDQLSTDPRLTDNDKARAKANRDNLLLRWDELDAIVQRSPPYIAAENLYTLSRVLASD